MDKNTWENYPVGTYVRVTWDDADREEYAVVRGKGESGGASAGNVGIYIGRHWDEIFDWAGASFEVLYLPKDEVILPGDRVRLVHNYYSVPAGTLGVVTEEEQDGYYVEFPGQGGAFWVVSDAVKKAVEG